MATGGAFLTTDVTTEWEEPAAGAHVDKVKVDDGSYATYIETGLHNKKEVFNWGPPTLPSTPTWPPGAITFPDPGITIIGRLNLSIRANIVDSLGTARVKIQLQNVTYYVDAADFGGSSVDGRYDLLIEGLAINVDNFDSENITVTTEAI